MGGQILCTGNSIHNPIVLDDPENTASNTMKQPATRKIVRVPRTSRRDIGLKRKSSVTEKGDHDMSDMPIKKGKRKAVCNKPVGGATPDEKLVANKNGEKRLKRFASDQPRH